MCAVSFDYPGLPKAESSTTNEASNFLTTLSWHSLQLTDNVEANTTISTYNHPGNLTSVKTLLITPLLVQLYPLYYLVIELVTIFLLHLLMGQFHKLVLHFLKVLWLTLLMSRLFLMLTLLQFPQWTTMLYLIGFCQRLLLWCVTRPWLYSQQNLVTPGSIPQQDMVAQW